MTKLEAFEKYMSEFATYRGVNMQWLMEASSHGRIFEYAWDEATKEERQACAELCEKLELHWKDQPSIAAIEKVTQMDCAHEIRKRGDA